MSGSVQPTTSAGIKDQLLKQMKGDYNASTSGIDVSQSLGPVGGGLGHLQAVKESKKDDDEDESAYKSSMTGTYTDSMSMTTSLPN